MNLVWFSEVMVSDVVAQIKEGNGQELRSCNMYVILIRQLLSTSTGGGKGSGVTRRSDSGFLRVALSFQVP
jgi:hypothetical protein